MIENARLVGVYCRTSTSDQNIEQQRKQLVDYCKTNNLEFRSYLDKAQSGRIKDRPQWSRLLRDCENGKVSTILVLKLDRITRRLEYAIEFYSWFIEHDDISLTSLYDSIDLRSPDGYFIFMLKSLLSERELQEFAYRRDIGIERAKLEGKYTGRKLGSKNKKKARA